MHHCVIPEQNERHSVYEVATLTGKSSRGQKFQALCILLSVVRSILQRVQILAHKLQKLRGEFKIELAQIELASCQSWRQSPYLGTP